MSARISGPIVSARAVRTTYAGVATTQLRAVWPSLAVVGLLLVVATVGLVRDRSPGTLNNVAFASVHLVVLLTGMRPALLPERAARAAGRDVVEEPVAA